MSQQEICPSMPGELPPSSYSSQPILDDYLGSPGKTSRPEEVLDWGPSERGDKSWISAVDLDERFATEIKHIAATGNADALNRLIEGFYPELLRVATRMTRSYVEKLRVDPGDVANGAIMRIMQGFRNTARDGEERLEPRFGLFVNTMRWVIADMLKSPYMRKTRLNGGLVVPDPGLDMEDASFPSAIIAAGSAEEVYFGQKGTGEIAAGVVRAILTGASSYHRAVVELRLEGHSLEEIDRILEKQPGTAKAVMSRFRARVRNDRHDEGVVAFRDWES